MRNSPIDIEPESFRETRASKKMKVVEEFVEETSPEEKKLSDSPKFRITPPKGAHATRPVLATPTFTSPIPSDPASPEEKLSDSPITPPKGADATGPVLATPTPVPITPSDPASSPDAVGDHHVSPVTPSNRILNNGDLETPISFEEVLQSGHSH